MNSILKNYLFTKHIFVNSEEPASGEDEIFNVLVSLGHMFGIRIRKGKDLVNKELINYAEEVLRVSVPEPFYRNFPRSVKKLFKESPELLAYDQLYHYMLTYGIGCFDEPGHSVFEEQFEKTVFNEFIEVKDYDVLTEEDAVIELRKSVENLLQSSRPLSPMQYQTVKTFYDEYDEEIPFCKNKDTAIGLLYETKDLKYLKFLKLPDVYNIVDYINFHRYFNEKTNKLNFKNKDRKFVARILDTFFSKPLIQSDRDVFEKRKFWVGLLHHIHYKPKNKEAANFVNMMRSSSVKNLSVYSQTERLINKENDPVVAAMLLNEFKGSGSLLRNLNYILSRCHGEREMNDVLNYVKADNSIVLLQLLYSYARADEETRRTFTFTKNGLLKVHKETDKEVFRRKSFLDPGKRDIIRQVIKKKLAVSYRDLLNCKVYIDPEFFSIAVPVNESTTNGGVGILPKGSWLPIPEGKKIRAFTYWEKVNDIDLSVIGLNENFCDVEEFSWRTMSHKQSDAICFSGDETSGYHGGSEFFDIDPELFKRDYSYVRYLVFCNNVFSIGSFANCICKAGFMTRDIIDSGEIYEPKTVKTSFTVDCPSSFAYLFVIDLETMRLIWLNINRDSNARVAGRTSFDFVDRYANMTDVYNVGEMITDCASIVVDNPEDADLIFSDLLTDENKKIVRSYDLDTIMAIANNRYSWKGGED